MMLRWCSVALLSLLVSVTATADPITVSRQNPHIYARDGKPILLVTSAEHYGAVINGEFDIIAYLDQLQKHGLNYTRIFPGAMFEPMGKYMIGNTLSPEPAHLVLPWARSAEPGYLVGGNKFDLDKWNPEYFARLRMLIEESEKRGIYVEIPFFNSQYADTWKLSPLYFKNNVNGMREGTWEQAQTTELPDLLAREDAYVAKITEEVNGYDNVILEVCDEPTDIGTHVQRAGPWLSHLADTVVATEKRLPKKHLLAQEMDAPYGSAADFTKDPRFTVIVGQYTWGREPDSDGGELGGIKALDQVYGLNKPIELNETLYYPLDYKNDKLADARAESWEFIVGGGAGFNQLNGAFTVADPTGHTEENERMLTSLGNLLKFMEGFHLEAMRADTSTLVGGCGLKAFCRMTSEPGRQYAFYLHHSNRDVTAYEALPGTYREKLKLRLPAGSYHITFVEPATGKVTAEETREVKGGSTVLSPPTFNVDYALSILRQP